MDLQHISLLAKGGAEINKNQKASYLKQKQALPLEPKIKLAKQRIQEWYEYWDGQVYISFSGGKDSTVLLHLVKSMYPDVPAVFCNTGLEYPEVRQFGEKMADVVLRPTMRFDEVVSKYGYPVISKEQAQYLYEYRNTKSEKLRNRRLYGDEQGRFKISNKWQYLVDSDFNISHHCCNVMKKQPFKKYEKETGRKSYVGTMAEESSLRLSEYVKTGCNAFEAARPMSKPLSVWTEQDILRYLKENNLEYATVYGDIVEGEDGILECAGVERTGCIFCAFGAHLESEPNRFQRLRETHPRQYSYCIRGGGVRYRWFLETFERGSWYGAYSKTYRS